MSKYSIKVVSRSEVVPKDVTSQLVTDELIKVFENTVKSLDEESRDDIEGIYIQKNHEAEVVIKQLAIIGDINIICSFIETLTPRMVEKYSRICTFSSDPLVTGTEVRRSLLPGLIVHRTNHEESLNDILIDSQNGYETDVLILTDSGESMRSLSDRYTYNRPCIKRIRESDIWSGGQK